MLSGGRVGDELFFVATIVGTPGLWMELASQYVEATLLVSLRRVLWPFKQCSTRKFGIPFHQRRPEKLKW
jgi:hypothetical protein